MGSTRTLDFHARLGPGRAARDGLLEAMARSGIARAAVCAAGVIDLDKLAIQIMEGGHVEHDADNEAVLASCQGTGGRLVPMYFANPHRDPGRYYDHGGRFYGVEISPAVHGVALTDERAVAIIEVAEELRHPVYVVCLGRPGSRARDLVALADAFPDVKFVLGHCGFVGVDLHSINLIAPRRNILAETSGSYTHIVRLAIDRLGTDRVLFGTEYPLQDPDVELAKLRALDLDPKALRKVASGNAERLLQRLTTQRRASTGLEEILP